MDIQVKYKEVDKEEEILNILREVENVFYEAGAGIRSKCKKTKADWCNEIDKLYKEESKEIESITVPGIFKNSTYIFKAVICEGNKRDYVYLSMTDVWKQDKGCLKEFIDILQQIHDQMD